MHKHYSGNKYLIYKADTYIICAIFQPNIKGQLFICKKVIIFCIRRMIKVVKSGNVVCL